jgi:hypothetical protein
MYKKTKRCKFYNSVCKIIQPIIWDCCCTFTPYYTVTLIQSQTTSWRWSISLRRNVGIHVCLPQYKASHRSRNILNRTMFSMHWKIKVTFLQHVMKAWKEGPGWDPGPVWNGMEKRKSHVLTQVRTPDPSSPLTVTIPTTLSRAPVCQPYTPTDTAAVSMVLLSLPECQYWQLL